MQCDCINISEGVVNNYPFVCPLCINSSISIISYFMSEISQLKAHMVKYIY